MPFNMFGDFIPEKEEIKPKGPVKVFLEKRKKSFVTVVTNLPLTDQEQKDLCSEIKKKLGCGGSYKNNRLEFQGDKTEKVKIFLKEKSL